MEENKTDKKSQSDDFEDFYGHKTFYSKTDKNYSNTEKNSQKDAEYDNLKKSNDVKKREYSRVEKILLLFALILGILFDRIISLTDNGISQTVFAFAFFWLAYILVIYIIYWEKFKHNKVLWYVGICCALMAIWNFIDFLVFSNENYAIINFLVLPATLMAHAVYAAGFYNLKQIPQLLVGYIGGWLVKPFSAWGHFFGTLGSLSNSQEKQKVIGKIVVGLLICVPILAIIIPLLMSSDGVFQYYIENLHFNFGSLLSHSLLVFIVMLLFYSFIWNIGFAKRKNSYIKSEFKLDNITSFTVLTVIEVVYLLFCIVQFTYLFAGAGLPADFSYADYAHRGFGEMCATVVINLVIFGIIAEGLDSKLKRPFLLILAAESLVMVLSNVKRLSLYIEAYDLTWLRMLAFWFTIYLIFAIIVFILKLFNSQIPAIATCLFILLGWWVLFGYANPKFIQDIFNENHTSINDITTAISLINLT